ncbi:MAG: O-antigen ligase family protein, partial [Firmicutes bacterium]|nr:O-antigen ligase family protein [Bacillota bacterium]
MTTKITPINRILKYGEQVSILTYLAATIFIVIAFFIAYSFGIELYVFLALLAFPLLWVMLNYPRVWIYCVVLTFPVFFINDDAGLTPTSVMGALFYNLFLICWLINRLFFRPVIASETKQSICNSKEIATPTARNDGKNKVNNSDASRSEIAKSNFASKKQLIGCDVLILLFYVLVLFNSVIAYSNGVEPFDWLSEYLLYSLLLYYFPIREYFDDKKSIITLLSLLFISAFILDIQQFYGYKNQIMKAALAYQLGGWGNINHQIYTASVIAGVTFLFYSKTVKGRLFAFVISVFSTAAIISTFARAFWLSLILVLFLLLFFLNYKQIIKLLIVLIVTAGLIGTALYMIFPKQAKLITKYATNRFSSSTKGKSDISVRSRFYEYREVISKIKESPLGGQGLRKKFSFYSPIAKHTIEYSFVHNGYLNMAYRVGIPLAALFYSV